MTTSTKWITYGLFWGCLIWGNRVIAQPAESPAATPAPIGEPAFEPEDDTLADPSDDSGEQNLQDLRDLKDLNVLLDITIPSVIGISKTQETLLDAPMLVHVVGQEELNRWGVRNFYETLQRTPGYSFYNIDYYGQYGIMARGVYSVWRYGYSLELMKIPDFGHTVFAPRFYKSIEIARGPGGLTWGSSAEAGLFNLNLRDDLRGGEASVEVGQYERIATDLLYGGKFGSKQAGDGVFVGFHYEQQGFPTQKNAFGIASERWKENGLNPEYALVAKLKYRVFKFLLYRDHADHVAPHLWFGGDQQAALSDWIEKTVGQKNVHDQMENLTFRGEYRLPSYDAKGAYLLNHVSGYLYGNFYKKQWWTESVALDTQRKHEIGFNAELRMLGNTLDVNLGGDFWGQDQLTAPSHTTTAAHDSYGINWYDTSLRPQRFTYHNLFGQVKYKLWNKLQLVGGARVDWEEDAKPDAVILGALRAGVIARPWDLLTLKLLYNETRRRPAFNERSGEPGNEKLRAIDLVSIVNYDERVQVDLGLSYQTLEDYIKRVDLSQALNLFENTKGLRNLAVEWAIKVRPIPPLLVYWNGSWNDAKALSDERSIEGEEVDLSLPHVADDTLLFVPAFNSFLGLEYAVLDLLSINVDWRAHAHIPYRRQLSGADLAGLTSSFSSSDRDRSAAIASFFDLSVSSRYFYGLFNVSVVALNLFDSQPRLPAFGEHASNQDGTLAPEGLRVMGRVTVRIP